MYPEAQRAFVDVEEISENLCGRNRPGHFRGVATVVLKLFHIIQPDLAFFGEKDYQQLAVLRRPVRDPNVPAQIYLYKAFLAAQGSIACGERNASIVKARAARMRCAAPEIELEYLDLVDSDTIRR
jgi:pantoate--beta-alanine ligase